MFFCTDLSFAQVDSVKKGGIIDGPSKNLNEQFFTDNYYYKSTSGDTIFYRNRDTVSTYLNQGNKWVIYYPNGKVKEQGCFKPIKSRKKLIKDYQVKRGKWKFYSIDGRLLREEKYK